MPGERQRLRVARVGDADQHRDAAVDVGTSAIDQLPAHPMADRRPFAARAENEQAVHAAGDQIIDEPLERRLVELVGPGERDHDRRNDAADRLAELLKRHAEIYLTIESLAATVPRVSVYRLPVVVGDIAALVRGRNWATASPTRKIVSVPTTMVKFACSGLRSSLRHSH